MKASRLHNLLFLVGASFGFLGLFHTSLGLPNWIEFPCGLIFVISVCTAVWLQRRAKKRGDPDIVPATPAQNRTHTWLLIVVFFLSCFAWPFVPPDRYGGVALPLHQRVIIGAATFAVLLPLIIVIRRRREKT